MNASLRVENELIMIWNEDLYYLPKLSSELIPLGEKEPNEFPEPPEEDSS